MASERPAGVRMTAQGDGYIVCWRDRLRREILRWAQDDSVGGWLYSLLAFPPSRGRSSLPLAGASERPAGLRMTSQGDGYIVCWRSRLRGEILPPAGVRMTALGNVISVFWSVRLRGEILPAIGRRKRTACGRQDDTRRADRIA